MAFNKIPKILGAILPIPRLTASEATYAKKQFFAPAPHTTHSALLQARALLITSAIVFSYNPSPRDYLSSTPQEMNTIQALAVSQTPVRSHRLPIAVPGSPRTAQEVQATGVILKPFDAPEENWQPGHRGVDLRSSPGQEIYASRGGTVFFAGSVAGTPVISIMHTDGIRTTYEPVLRAVTKGEDVRRGQLIGYLADASVLPETARRDPGLSWGARREQSYLDPLSLLGSPRIVLKK